MTGSNQYSILSPFVIIEPVSNTEFGAYYRVGTKFKTIKEDQWVGFVDIIHIRHKISLGPMTIPGRVTEIGIQRLAHVSTQSGNIIISVLGHYRCRICILSSCSEPNRNMYEIIPGERYTCS